MAETMTNTQNEPLPPIEWLDKSARSASFHTEWYRLQAWVSDYLRQSIIEHARTLAALDAAQKEIERLQEILEGNASDAPYCDVCKRC